ncbi:NAD(P)-dependent oxidoreductase [uncultured Anaerococcus sp.]|uniref:NAD-dependent epimerase/dehydratase family protein n=1 Tax=uncultured Anaerococcus sp. TaxID=293428 RepID=UPI00261FDBAC|nr:NAD(P)-dependent oxidoreductase [uncultured Anaerococcus sp.]
MKNIRKIFILGGANLFAKTTIKHALDLGYAVKAVDLIRPSELEGVENLEFLLEDFFDLTDAEAIRLMEDCDSFIYAGGVSDLSVPRKPAGKFFYERNVLPTGRVVRLARKAGIKNFLLLGDYKTEIAEKNESLRKNAYHKEPYIQTRFMQEAIANFEGEPLMNVSVLRPGVVIGKANKSIMEAHIDLVKANKKIPVTDGVIPIISAEALARAAIYALELEGDKKTYAVATSKISYREIYEIILEAMDKVDEKSLVEKGFVDLLPAYEKDAKVTNDKGLEHGISQVNMLRSMTMDLSFKSDFDLGDEDLREKLRGMIDLYLKGTPVRTNKEGQNPQDMKIENPTQKRNENIDEN